MLQDQLNEQKLKTRLIENAVDWTLEVCGCEGRSFSFNLCAYACTQAHFMSTGCGIELGTNVLGLEPSQGAHGAISTFESNNVHLRKKNEKSLIKMQILQSNICKQHS